MGLSVDRSVTPKKDKNNCEQSTTSTLSQSQKIERYSNGSSAFNKGQSKLRKLIAQ